MTERQLFAAPSVQKPYGAPLTPEPLPPSGPDGKGQARGQARDARG